MKDEEKLDLTIKTLESRIRILNKDRHNLELEINGLNKRLDYLYEKQKRYQYYDKRLESEMERE